MAGDNIHLSIIKPDNTILYDWNITASTTSSSWYYYWYYSGVYDQEGEWKWEVTYGGETVTHTFNIGTLDIEEETMETTSLYPNPATESVTIKTPRNLQSARIYDVSGKLIKNIFFTDNVTYTIDLSNMAKGMYFLTVVSSENDQERFKLIKK